jgi:hypothetical protein
MIGDLLNIVAQLFLPLVIEAAAFVVGFSVLLVVIKSLDDVLSNLKQRGGE